ncbi:hypothetical protein SCHPADRAFT_902134 [Schizopora paradoxa]|uniref:DUF726-domain-containing protein n=1 Tax=Schizopora paradoxa TaxID=27342 RepID=A0A0H2RVV7_9AGAM|nr:hypothetical protein SCHPADRAFT_902134 [Schizopora paradoxa]
MQPHRFLTASRFLSRQKHAIPYRPFRLLSSECRNSPSIDENNSDLDDVIPREPTWSIHELISSYPRPQISSDTLKKLHELSALVPPEEGTPEHTRIRRELEEMVRLVEAVKLVDTSSVQREDGAIPDGRIWPEGVGMVLTKNGAEKEFDGEDGEVGVDLLKYASTTKNGLYIVEADRRKKGNQ